MAMLHPWALLAGLAVAVPLLVHWLTRPRPRRLPLSTIRFVKEAVKQRKARYRLRDVLVLLLRCAAVALLAIAFARPLIGPRPLVAEQSSANTSRIVIIDQSLGMAAVSHGATSFDRARAIAARYLSFSPGARCDLILAAAKPRSASQRLTTNLGALRDELATAHPLPQRMDVAAAINRAAELLSASPPEHQRELVIISNFQRSHWASADFSPLPKDTRIQLESVAPPEAPANLAVLNVAAQGRVEQGREARIDIEVANYSSASRQVQVELTVGPLKQSAQGLCAANTVTTLSVNITPLVPGWEGGEARLVDAGDALSADDARPFVLDVRPRPTYVLITRDPATPHPSSSHFLERALAPFRPAPAGAALAPSERVKRILPDSVDRESLAGADLLLVDHPGRISQQSAGLLAALLRRGRPLFYVAAEPIDATNLKLIEQAAGSDLKMPVEFSPAPASTMRRDLFIVEFRRDQAPFSTFGESLPAAMGPLRFGGGLASRPLPQGLADDVLASYSDRSACLITAACGSGTLAVLNADLNESNLIASPVFVPLLQELVDRLLKTHSSEAAASGEPLASYLPPEAGSAEGLKISGPMPPDEAAGSIANDGSFVIWRWDAAGPPGVYAIKRDATTQFALAIAPPRQVSNLAPLDLSLLKGKLAGGRSVAVEGESAEAQRRDNLWSWLLVACAACILLEFFMLRLFRA